MRRLLNFIPLTLLVSAAMAETPLQPVVFAFHPEWDTKALDTAIRESLSRTPSFNLMSVVTPETLVIRIPDGIATDGHEEKKLFTFTAVFFRNGDKIGVAYETCKASAPADCANQLASDAQSAAGAAGAK
jgi:hypothetical protein